MLCVKNCPGKAISGQKSRKFTIGGREFEIAELDEFRCATVFQSSSPELSAASRGSLITPKN